MDNIKTYSVGTFAAGFAVGFAVGALSVGGLIGAATAHADAGTAYGYENEARICMVFEAVPSAGGLVGIAEAIHKEEPLLSDYQIGEAIGAAVKDYCPSMIPTLTEIIDSMPGDDSPTPQSPSVLSGHEHGNFNPQIRIDTSTTTTSSFVERGGKGGGKGHKKN